ncbi:MAG: hypothetical protein ACFFDK_19670 [Promethearchaeota archaeon]
MKLNENKKLVLRDVYLYDIESCHYSIMENLGLDLSGVNKEDKLERNIQIGKMMSRNPKLTSLLRNTTRSIIDEYIRINGITDSDLVIRQYDGILLTRTLRVTDLRGIPLNIRKHFHIFISSIDRNMYIALDSENKTTIKGVPFRYSEMDKIYEAICKINYTRKESIFRNLQKIKDYIMTSQNTRLFAIPIDDKRFNIFLKDFGQIEVLKSTLKIMDPDDIDRERYFNFYIAPFTKSVVVDYVR